MEENLRKAALEYHEQGRPGKISIAPTKTLSNQRDLALAYSPGVAAACEEIVNDPANAFRYTARGNLVGVITNGTAVLGLGTIGPLASKPVMEGKAVLFKKFAGIDVFDIEINEEDPDKLVEIIAGLEPTFGGINLEDIKAPECFIVERKLRERMRIPVFHDDQHGTAITVCAAFLNGIAVVGKDISTVKVAVSGAGAAALACLDLMVDMGLPLKNIWVSDIEGVVYEGRTVLMDPDKLRFAQKTEARTLGEIIQDADVFLGLSAGGVLKPDMVRVMAKDPLILALANPNPEILPEDAHAVRDDVVMATGRSDYPNQVNNVLCFPYIFRGALDVGATTITREMEKAAVRAIAQLAQEEQSEVVAAAYGSYDTSFGRESLIPKPFDPRLIGAMMVRFGEADGMICGTISGYNHHLRYIDQVIGKRPGTQTYAAMNILLLTERTLVMVDTHVNDDPTAEQIAEFTIAAAAQMRRLNLVPKAALLSRSSFGSGSSASGAKMSKALELIREQAPDLEVDGEMHGDAALDETLRKRIMPWTTLKGSANLLVCPGMDSANIAYNLLKTAAGGNIAIGPFLLGVNAPIHILTSSSTVRRIVNMTALTVVEANLARQI